MQIALNNYQNLLTEVRKLIGQTEQKILADINHEKISMSWQIGKMIEKHLLKNSRAGHGEQIFLQLEKDIFISKRTLYQMRLFYKTYPILPAKDKALSWSHYRNLLVVKSDERRKYLEDLTVEKKLGSGELQKKISAQSRLRKKISKPENVKLKCERGVLYAYKIASLQGSGEKFLDCGFNIFTEVSDSWTQTQSWTGFVTPSTGSAQSRAGAAEGTAKGTAKGTEREDGVTNPVLRLGGVLQQSASQQVALSAKKGEKFSLQKTELQPRQLHTYKAYLERVVDGDTIHVVLDLGFKIQHREILRLAKINAPEAETFEGAQSKKVLEKILKDVPFLIVKTNKTDIYGRYIADVFLAKSEKESPHLGGLSRRASATKGVRNHFDPQKIADEGEYLNQLLLDVGAAGVY